MHGDKIYVLGGMSYKKNEDGSIVEYIDKDLDLDDSSELELFKEYLAEFWKDTSYEHLIENHD